jgi:hypothetical protein
MGGRKKETHVQQGVSPISDIVAPTGNQIDDALGYSVSQISLYWEMHDP